MPSLFDRILTLKKHSIEGINLIDDLRLWQAALNSAQCFLINDDVMRIADSIAQSDGKRLLDVRRFVRLPYRTCWIEYNHLFNGGGGGTGVLPSQIGCLLQGEGREDQGVMSFAWYSHEDGLTLAPMGFLFDYSDNLSLAERYLNTLGTTRKQHFAAASAYTATIMQEQGKGKFYDRRISGLEREEHAKLHGSLLSVKSPLSPILTSYPMAAMAARDVVYEGQVMSALLSALNSKNLTAAVIDDRDLTKLNKHRTRSGKPLLRNFTVIKLNLSRAMQRKIEAAGGEAAYRQHLVRGHYKVRKTGIFWWSPFNRGAAGDDNSPPPVKRHHYELRV